jgi:AcrR family transcriptional regulator
MSRTPPVAPGPSLRTQHRDTTRRTLIRAAGQCFRKRGFAATTVEDIARAAGTTRTTFYLHFKGKGDIVNALIESVGRDTEALLAELETAVATHRRDELRTWLAKAFEFWERAASVARAEEEAASLHPDVQAGRSRSFEHGVAAVARGLELAGVSDKAGRDARAILAYSQLQNLFHRWLRVGWDVDRDQILEVMTDMWTAAFRCTTSTRRGPG